MKIGLYFGSFNPIHHGHLIIANYIVQHTDIDQVWFVISPQNPLKKSASLLNEYHRLYLVQISIEDEPSLKASSSILFLKAPLLQISSTYIRETIKNGKSIRYLVPEKVKREIDQNGYYRSPV